MTPAMHVAAAVARRSLTHTFKNPALLLPSIIFPLVFLVAFAGGLSSVSKVPGFDYEPGYLAFQFVFVFLQASAFGGIFTGFGVAADFESGFARRLFLAAPQRIGLLFAYLASAAVRFAVTAAMITVVALAVGMDVPGGGVDFFGLVALGLLVNMTASLWGFGLSMRAKTLQVAPLMQVPVFVLLFTAPVYVPRNLLHGWFETVAKINPATALLEAGRGFIAGDPVSVGLAFGCGAGLVALLFVYGLRGLRRAEAEL
jgi:ABC-2 type transport system permease protein